MSYPTFFPKLHRLGVEPWIFLFFRLFFSLSQLFTAPPPHPPLATISFCGKSVRFNLFTCLVKATKTIASLFRTKEGIFSVFSAFHSFARDQDFQSSYVLTRVRRWAEPRPWKAAARELDYNKAVNKKLRNTDHLQQISSRCPQSRVPPLPCSDRPTASRRRRRCRRRRRRPAVRGTRAAATTEGRSARRCGRTSRTRWPSWTLRSTTEKSKAIVVPPISKKTFFFTQFLQNSTTN